MNKTVSACLIALSFLLVSQPSFAKNPLKDLASVANHHSAAGVALGNFIVDCHLGGSGNADVRNITVDGHSQLVAHLNATNFTTAIAIVESLDTTQVTLQTPMTFRLVSGTGKWLIVGVEYTPHNSNTPVDVLYVTPDSNAPTITPFPTNPLIDNGDGTFTIPVGTGNSQGARLNVLSFSEVGDHLTCNNHVSNINHLTINNRFIPIDTTAPSASCVNECVIGGDQR